MLKLGIIGTHIITDQMLDAAKQTGEYKLTAVYSRTMARAQEYGKPYGATEFYDKLDQFFSDGDFDVVYIASPNSLHFSQTKLAIEHDKDIILEKPAFVNTKEFETIENLLKQHPQVRLVEAARHIHVPLYQEGLKKIHELDHCQGGTITVMKYSGRYDKVLAGENPAPNIFTTKFAGGALQDLGVYAVYSAVQMFGKPNKAQYFPTLAKTGVDAMGVAILTYDNYEVTLNVGKTSNSYLPSEIYGLKDTVVFDSVFNTKKVTYYDADKKAHPVQGKVYDNSMVPEMQNFADLFNNPNDGQEQKKYEDWHQLSKTVNEVMTSLRQSANLVFPSDN